MDAYEPRHDAPPTAVEPEPEWDEADNMCPNCVTPWKCNGPHEFAETVAGKRAAASSGPAKEPEKGAE